MFLRGETRSSSKADATIRPFAGEGTGLNAGKSLPILCNTVGISVTPYSLCARSMILPPVPSPKSCHRFKERLTLNDGVRSCLKGERYHTLSPCLLTGENPARPRKSSSGIFFTSSMFIACLFYRLFKSHNHRSGGMNMEITAVLWQPLPLLYPLSIPRSNTAICYFCIAQVHRP